jgi:hypothetical protein
MSPLQAGSASSDYTLEIGGVRKAVTEAKRLIADLRKEAAKPLAIPNVRSTAALNGNPQAAINQQKLQVAQQRTALTANQAAVAAQKLATEEARTAREVLNASAAQDRAAKTAIQLAAAQQRAARARQNGGLGPALPRTVESFGTEAINQFKSGLIGIVGPAALATAGIAALSGTVNSFKQAFTFKAELDATNQAIRTNLEGVRDSGKVFDDAARFADKYRLTQQETTAILASSTDILRVSTASVADLESALLRLQSRDVSKPISEAARALRELNSGDVTSIKELFNVSAKEALRMKDEIAAGGDAVAVLNGYLDRAGVSMAVLENRAKGAAGALNEQKIAQEGFAIAQAKVASSAGGILFVQALTRQYQGLANILNGDALAGLQATGNELRVSAAGANVYTAALLAGASAADAQALADRAATQAANGFAQAQRNGGGGTFEFTEALKVNVDALSKEAKAKLADQIETDKLSALQSQLERDSLAAASGLLGAGNQALLLAEKYGIATQEAQALIEKQQKLAFNATALADQRVGERDPGNNLTALEFNKFDKLADEGRAAQTAADKAIATQARAEKQRIADAQFQYDLSIAKNNAAKIAVYKRKLAATTDAADRLDIQATINQLSQDKPKKPGGTGLTALDKSEIGLIDDKVARLNEVNRRLSLGNLTQLARNQLVREQRDLQKEISTESRRQLEDQLSLSESIINNRKAARDEAKQLKLFGRVAARGGERGEQAADEIALIEIARQRRALAIQGLTDATGGLRPIAVSTPANVVAPVTSPLTSSQTQPQGSGTGDINIHLAVDGKSVADGLLPRMADEFRRVLRGASAAGL